MCVCGFPGYFRVKASCKHCDKAQSATKRQQPIASKGLFKSVSSAPSRKFNAADFEEMEHWVCAFLFWQRRNMNNCQYYVQTVLTQPFTIVYSPPNPFFEFPTLGPLRKAVSWILL